MQFVKKWFFSSSILEETEYMPIVFHCMEINQMKRHLCHDTFVRIHPVAIDLTASKRFKRSTSLCPCNTIKFTTHELGRDNRNEECCRTDSYTKNALWVRVVNYSNFNSIGIDCNRLQLSKVHVVLSVDIAFELKLAPLFSQSMDFCTGFVWRKKKTIFQTAE